MSDIFFFKQKFQKMLPLDVGRTNKSNIEPEIPRTLESPCQTLEGQT